MKTATLEEQYVSHSIESFGSVGERGLDCAHTNNRLPLFCCILSRVITLILSRILFIPSV